MTLKKLLEDKIVKLSAQQQKSKVLNKTLKQTARHCRQSRTKLSDYQQSAIDACACNEICEDMCSQMSELSRALTAAHQDASQHALCLDIAKKDIGALNRFNQSLQRSVQQQTDIAQSLKLQLNSCMSENSSLVMTNQRLKATVEWCWRPTFGLHRVLTNFRNEATTAHSSPHATESNCSLAHSSPHATAVDSSVGKSSPGTELGRLQDHSSRHACQGSDNAKTPSNDSKASADADGRMQGQQNAVAELQLQVADLRAGREEDQKQLAEDAAAA